MKLKSRRFRKSRRSRRRIRGGGELYRFVFHSANGEIRPPGEENPLFREVTGSQTITEVIGASAAAYFAYGKDHMPLNFNEPISSQASRIPDKKIHLQDKGNRGIVSNIE